VPELRGDERLQLSGGAGRGAGRLLARALPGRLSGLEAGLAAFGALQLFLLLGRRAGWAVLLWWDREAWPVTLALWLGCLLATAACFLAAAALVRAVVRADSGPRPALPPAGGIALAFAAVAAGAALRLLPAGDVPPGVSADAVYAVLPILRAPDGGWAAGGPFGGAPGLVVTPFFLVAARPVLGVFGGGETGLVVLSALAGLSAVAGTAWLAREAAGGRAALLAVGLASLAAWPLRLSRWAWAESLTIAALAAGVACALRAVRTGRAAWAAAAGTFGGLAIHGHPSGPVVVLLLLSGATVVSLRDRPRRRLLVAAAAPVALSLAGWIGVYAHWSGSVGARYGQVGLWSPARGVELARVPAPLRLPAAALSNLVSYTGLPFTTGDPNPRMGIPGRPLLSPAFALAAFAGLGVLGARWAKGDARARALAALAAASLLSGIAASTDAAPNSLRTCALMAPLSVVAALGLEALAALGAARKVRPSLQAGLVAALLAGFEVVPAYVEWPALADVRAAFFAGQTEAARLRRRLAPGPTAVDPSAIPEPVVFEAVAFGGPPLEPVREVPRSTPAALAAGRAPGRLWYVTDARGAAELEARGLKASRPTARRGPSVLLVVR